MCKINYDDKVKIINLQGTGLEGYESEFLGKTGTIVYIDREDNELPYSVKLDNTKETTFYLHSIHLEKVSD